MMCFLANIEQVPGTGRTCIERLLEPSQPLPGELAIVGSSAQGRRTDQSTERKRENHRDHLTTMMMKFIRPG